MNYISISDMFKISIGPSSSHTMGPWVAALRLVNELRACKKLNQVAKLEVVLLGSLAKTGLGHHTPMGVLMGLSGHLPDQIDSNTITDKVEAIKSSQKILLAGKHEIVFPYHDCLRFDYTSETKIHPNTLVFHVHYRDGTAEDYTYYSIGGGFVRAELSNPKNLNQEDSHQDDNNQDKTSYSADKDSQDHPNPSAQAIPYPFSKAKALQDHIDKEGMRMHEICLANEMVFKSKQEIYTHAGRIYECMSDCIFRGCHAEGILPGGLRVSRRAPGLAKALYRGGAYENKEQWFEAIRQTATPHHEEVSRWVSCFALAVNEENATCGQIVTAPTNGAAGVIPAILMYFLTFDPSSSINREEKIFQFLIVASNIGFLFKENATISAAAGGCQGEIGVSSAMASAGLTYVKGGDARRAMVAAEIAMEHHLGLTCDPIKGLVQVPCIERNTMGAAKAIIASQLAFASDPLKVVVNLDEVIQTMWQTANDMSNKYKETSEGGLAVNVSAKYSEC